MSVANKVLQANEKAQHKEEKEEVEEDGEEEEMDLDKEGDEGDEEPAIEVINTLYFFLLSIPCYFFHNLSHTC